MSGEHEGVVAIRYSILISFGSLSSSRFLLYKNCARSSLKRFPPSLRCLPAPESLSFFLSSPLSLSLSFARPLPPPSLCPP